MLKYNLIINFILFFHLRIILSLKKMLYFYYLKEDCLKDYVKIIKLK